jgi:hypothetical protein
MDLVVGKHLAVGKHSVVGKGLVAAKVAVAVPAMALQLVGRMDCTLGDCTAVAARAEPLHWSVLAVRR